MDEYLKNLETQLNPTNEKNITHILTEPEYFDNVVKTTLCKTLK